MCLRILYMTVSDCTCKSLYGYGTFKPAAAAAAAVSAVRVNRAVAAAVRSDVIKALTSLNRV